MSTKAATPAHATTTAAPAREMVKTKTLYVHAAQKACITRPAEGPAFDALVKSVEELGIIDALVIDEKNGVMGGQWRLAAAQLLGLEEVPCIRRRSEEAPLIIAQSLAARKHYTVGALAYILLPYAQEALTAAKAAQLENLKKGPAARQPTGSALGKTYADTCRALGFSEDTAKQAAKVRAVFEDEGTEYGLTDADRASCLLTVREFWEPKLLAGDISLGGILMAYEGLKAAKAPAFATALDSRAEYSRHIREGIAKSVQHWGRLKPDELAEMAKTLPDIYAKLPGEALAVLETAIAKARKEQAKAAKA